MTYIPRGGLQALAGALLGISTVFVGLRFYARRRAKVAYLANDWLMLIAYIGLVGDAICVFYANHYELIGYTSLHFPAKEIKQLAPAVAQVRVSINVLTFIVLASTKASALLFYQRVFCSASARTSKLNIVILTSVFVVAMWLTCFIILIFYQYSTHFTALYGPAFEQYCVYSVRMLYAGFISDVVLDVWVVVLPIPLISRLHMSRRKKIIVIGTFSLAFMRVYLGLISQLHHADDGSRSVAASIARLVSYVDYYHISETDPSDINDQSDLTIKILFYFMLEAGMALIAINMPSVGYTIYRIGSETFNYLVRNVSSLLSKGSLSSEAPTPERDLSEKSSSKQNFTVYADHGSSEARATHDLEEGPVGPMSDNIIMVENSVHVSTGRGRS